jgi:hypothetical protein
MAHLMDFIKTALLSLIAVSLILLLARIDFLVSDLHRSLDIPQDSSRIHEPQGRLIPKSDPSPPDIPDTIDSTLYV